MTISKRLGPLFLVLSLALLTGAGCTKQARLARTMRQADADFAAERYDKAEIGYKTVLRPALDAHALGNLGLIYSREGRIPAAFACLKKSVDMNPNNAEVKTALGVAYLSLRSQPDAMREAREALALQPTNREAMVLLSEAVPSAQEIPQTQAFLRALPGQPDRFAEYHVALATLDLKQHNLSAAEAGLRQALIRDPKSADAHYRMSQIYFQRTNIFEATNELKLAASLAPWRSPIRLKGVDFALQYSGQAAAHKALEEIVTHAPDFLPAWTALMRMDFALKQFDDCAKDIAAILERDPDEIDASVEIGLIALTRGETAQARAAFEKLQARRPNVPK